MSATHWLRAAAAFGTAAMVLASSCTSGLGLPLVGLPPPSGDPVPDVDTHVRGLPADQLRGWAAKRAPALNMPVRALEAYAYAAKVAEVENPKCHLAWTTLAGIGMVESHNGTYRGATIAPNGDVRPLIRGVRLNGGQGTMRIVGTSADTPDGGHDDVVQAMGPMQFIPETWRLYGVDAHNNSVSSPDNIDDAALSAAGYLCFRGGNLATPRGWLTALRAYNYSELYARTVRDWAAAYAGGHPL